MIPQFTPDIGHLEVGDFCLSFQRASSGLPRVGAEDGEVEG